MTKLLNLFVYVVLLTYSALSLSEATVVGAKATEALDSVDSVKKTLQDIDASKAPDKEELMKKSIELGRLEAEVAKQQQANNQSPRRKFIGARTKNAEEAIYLERWRQKVEQIGNTHYPKAASEQHLYGLVRVSVSILADGQLEKVEIDQSSGSKILDDAVVEIVSMAAPYQPFSNEMKASIDILTITRSFNFTHE